jgi:phosphate transport system substrate-binding protein
VANRPEQSSINCSFIHLKFFVCLPFITKVYSVVRYTINMKFKFIAVPLALAILANAFFITNSYAYNLQGAGSTFAATFIDRCRVDFAKTTGDSVVYTASGSGAGKNMFANGITDFAMSDVPYSATEGKPSKEFVYIPLVAGPVGIIYRLDKYSSTIKMSTDTLAKIFSGQITMWNDPQIVSENIHNGRTPKIPATKIKVVYRIDGSGTSEVFTSYLNAVEPKIWTKPGNKNFNAAFPGDINKSFMSSASGSQGVAMVQTTTNGSIGYNEISYARGLKTASIQNKAGSFMQPTVSAASVFLKDFAPEPNGVVKVNYNNPNRFAYNISTFTYGIASKQKSESNESVKKFFNYMIDVCGKKAKDLGYSPISGSMLKFSKARISEVGSK